MRPLLARAVAALAAYSRVLAGNPNNHIKRAGAEVPVMRIFTGARIHKGPGFLALPVALAVFAAGCVGGPEGVSQP